MNAAATSRIEFDGEVEYLDLMKSSYLIHRFVTQGYDYAVASRILGGVKKQEDWFHLWMQAGDEYLGLAERALDSKHALTAGNNFVKAALSYHWAQFFHFSRFDEKERAQAIKLVTYRRAYNLVNPKIEPLSATFDGAKLPILIRRPSENGRFPTIIFVCGSDSTKEENFFVENEYIQRGFTTVSFDGPGQGEVWPTMKMRPDFHRAISAVIDAIEHHPGVDPARIGVSGKSFGGLLVPAAAATDPRIKACAANGGYFDTSFYDWTEPLRAIRFQYMLGVRTREEAKAKSVDYNLAPYIRDVKVPLLVIHGGLDKIPSDQAKRIAASAGKPGEFVELPGGLHCCYNVAYIATPLAADWFKDKLS